MYFSLKKKQQKFDNLYCFKLKLEFPNGHYLNKLTIFYQGTFIYNSDNSDDGQEFGGSIYQKVSPRLETGIQLAWSSGSNNTRFGIGAKYDLDKDASLRAKVNNASQIGLGYQQRLRDGKISECFN